MRRQPNHTQIPNWFIEDEISRCTGAETKVFLAICRKTIGWHKDLDRISYSQFMTMTGLSVNAVRKAIAGLLEKELICREGTEKHHRYEVNFDDEVYQKVIEPLAESDRAGVSKSDTTKESLKETQQNKTTATKKRSGKTQDYTSEPYGKQFLEVFALYPPRRPSNPKRTAYKAFAKLMRDGVAFDDLKRAVVNYAKERKGKEPEFTMMARTFFGPNERWQDFLSLTDESPKSTYHANVVEDDIGIGELVKKAQRRPA